MAYVLTSLLTIFYPDTVHYFNCMNNLMPYLSVKYQREMVEGNLLRLIIDKCVRYADYDPLNN